MRPMRVILQLVRPFLCTVDKPEGERFTCIAADVALRRGVIDLEERERFDVEIYHEMHYQGLPRSRSCLAQLLEIQHPVPGTEYENLRVPAYIAARDKWLDDLQLKLEKQS